VAFLINVPEAKPVTGVWVVDLDYNTFNILKRSAWTVR